MYICICATYDSGLNHQPAVHTSAVETNWGLLDYSSYEREVQLAALSLTLRCACFNPGAEPEYKATLRGRRGHRTSLLRPLHEWSQVQHQAPGHVQLRRVRSPGLCILCQVQEWHGVAQLLRGKHIV